MVALNIDVRKIEPAAGFDPVPAGWYKVMMDESGPMTPTKSGTGAFLPLRFVILEGQYKNKKLFARLNLQNANPVAQEIAHQELSAIGHAVGVLLIETSEQLHNIPLWVSVKVRKGGINETTGDSYDDNNEIKTYKSATFVPPNSGNSAAAPAGVVVPPVATAPTSSAPFVPPPLPTPAPVPTPPPVAVAPTFEMAPGETFTREQYHTAGWTDETLIAGNKMRIVPAAAPAPAPAPTPSAPPGPAVAEQPWTKKPEQPWTAPAPTGPSAAPAPAPAPMPPAAAAAQEAKPPWSTAPKA